MSLIKLTSDKGQGYVNDPYFIKADSIISVTGATGNHCDNKTLVTLQTGEKIAVRESVYEVNRQINAALAPAKPAKVEVSDPTA